MATTQQEIQHHRYEDQQRVLGVSLFEKISQAKILVVGAGGIGCELLKNLAMTGFSNIHVIDLDTIDISNLNRQFLFQKQHVGQSKSMIAAKAVQTFNPDLKITSEVGNIKSPEYSATFFKGFDLVINALDNIDARRHVNRICLSVGKPLVESGTAGYLGQVQVIQKGVTECYECQPKPRPKQYPYCTIRSNPTLPIHCIIWAKEEFTRHFGGDQNVKEDEEEALDDEEYRKDEEVLQKKHQEEDFAHWLFYKLFHTDVFRKLRVAMKTEKDLWKGRPRPIPLSYDNLPHEHDSTSTAQAGLLKDQALWTLKENADVFLRSVTKLKKRSEEQQGLSWDKDDEDALDFVTSASNLRAHVFSIPKKSRFDVKAEAGNIIPAIATTNAIIAGMIVMEAVKILNDQLSKCKYTYLLRKPSNKRLLMAVEHEKPSPNCYVCNSNSVTAQINTNTSTFGYFITEILKKNLGMAEPSIYKADQGSCVFESGEDLDEEDLEFYEEQKKKTLREMGLTDTTLRVVDQIQDLELSIFIFHNENLTEETPYEVSTKGSNDFGSAPIHSSSTSNSDNNTSVIGGDGDDIVLVEAPPPPTAVTGSHNHNNETTSTKRKMEKDADSDDETSADASIKRARTK